MVFSLHRLNPPPRRGPIRSRGARGIYYFVRHIPMRDRPGPGARGRRGLADALGQGSPDSRRTPDPQAAVPGGGEPHASGDGPIWEMTPEAIVRRASASGDGLIRREAIQTLTFGPWMCSDRGRRRAGHRDGRTAIEAPRRPERGRTGAIAGGTRAPCVGGLELHEPRLGVVPDFPPVAAACASGWRSACGALSVPGFNVGGVWPPAPGAGLSAPVWEGSCRGRVLGQAGSL